KHEGDRERRTGFGGRGDSREGEDASADDCANSETDKLIGTESALKGAFAGFLRFAEERAKGFCGEERIFHAAWLLILASTPCKSKEGFLTALRFACSCTQVRNDGPRPQWSSLHLKQGLRSRMGCQAGAQHSLAFSGQGCSLPLGGVTDLAVLHAVGEVDDHADDEPHDQAHPGDAVQAGHESQRDDDTENGNHGNQRRAKWPLEIRPARAKDHYGRADDDEGEKGADADHLPKAADGNKRAEESGTEASDGGGLPGCTETRVNVAGPLP